VTKTASLAAVALTIGLVSTTATFAQSMPSMHTVERGSHSNVDAPRQAVVRTQAEWAALWKTHDYDHPAPVIDFNHDMALAVFMGSRPTGGYATEIVSVDARDGKVVVRYRETAPAPGTITAQVLTSPFHIVTVPRHAGAATFEKLTAK